MYYLERARETLLFLFEVYFYKAKDNKNKQKKNKYILKTIKIINRKQFFYNKT